MWMAQQESADKTASPAEGELQLPTIVANHHILFLDKKASSSGAVKPPMADDLLEHYTPEPLFRTVSSFLTRATVSHSLMMRTTQTRAAAVRLSTSSDCSTRAAFS